MPTARKHISHCKTAWKQNPLCPKCGLRLEADREQELIRSRSRTPPLCRSCQRAEDRLQEKRKKAWEKENRRYARALGKWILEQEYPEQIYTPLRKVSVEEMQMLSARHAEIYGKRIYRSGGVPWVPVFTTNYGWGDIRIIDHIMRPGYYRVEDAVSAYEKPIKEMCGIDCCLKTTCKDGFPSHHQSRIIKEFDSWWYSKKRTGRIDAHRKKEAEREEQKRRASLINEIKTANHSRGTKFFQAMAMAGSVNNKKGKKGNK